MPIPSTHKQLNAVVPREVRDKLAALAEAHHLSLHQYHLRLLCDHAANTALPAEPIPAPPPADDYTETLQVWMPVELAERLSWTAKQLVDDKGRHLQAGPMARLLLTHALLRETNVVLDINSRCRPDFVDPAPMMREPRYSKREWRYITFLPVHCTLDLHEAVQEEARDKGITMIAVVRRVLDSMLPHIGVPV